MSSAYLRHLPEILRTAPPEGGTAFLGSILKVFEALLDGRDDAPGATVRPLVSRIAGYVDHLDPSLAPLTDADAALLGSEFLRYLASWVALELDLNWDMSKQRLWLSQIVPLYKRRGTRDGIQAYLSVFVGDQVTVD